MTHAPQPDQLLRDLLAAEPLAGRRILLYGAGDAALAVWLAQAGAELALLDPSREVALAALRHTHDAGAGRRVRAVEAPSTSLPMFADLAFDIIVLQHGLAFDIPELARILRPAARLISPAALGPDASAFFTAAAPHPSPSGLGTLFRRSAPLFWCARRLSA